MRRWLVALMAAALVPVVAAAQLLLSEEDEIELGRQAASEVEQSLPLLADDAVGAYLTTLGQVLVARSGRPGLAYRFQIVDSPEINAFALPGGFIYVNRGLIEAVDRESELAGVLAHEIGHVVARHGAIQAERLQLAALGLSALDRLLGRGDGVRTRLAGLAAEMVTAGAFMRFSRDAEREADRLAALDMIASGYDPRAMITFFERLDAMRADRPTIVERFFASHPAPAERAANVRDVLDGLEAEASDREDAPAFLAAKHRLVELPRRDGPDAFADLGARTPPVPPARYPGDDDDHRIAALFAPIFHQALGPSPRYDYITSFDFDGDWRGDNNWDHAEDPAFPLAARVYYAVDETESHYFVFYAAFHPRDYKGGNERGALLSEAMREAARLGARYDPTGLSQDAVLAHENDLEGCLVVARKRGADPTEARVEFVEAMAHNAFLKYVTPTAAVRGFEAITLRGQHAELYVEPKGHGIGAYRGTEAQRQAAVNGSITYSYEGRAGQPQAGRPGRVGYDLVPMYRTLWLRAFQADGDTYDEAATFEPRALNAFSALDEPPVLGQLGAAFRGAVGGVNMARPPWGWFDVSERGRPAGEWFFDPADTVARHFVLDRSFSTRYLHQPFLGIFRAASRQ